MEEVIVGCVYFFQKHPNMSADVFIVSLGGLINHKNVQSDSSTPSWSQFAIKFTMVITIGNEPKPEYPWEKKQFSLVLVQI